MMVEKSGTIRFQDIPMAKELPQEQKELAEGMVRVNHLYRSALKVAVTQMEILDEEFASLYDHSPIHHIEYRIKTLDSIIDKLRRRDLDVTIDNIYKHITDVAGIRVICNYLDDIYYLRSLLTRSDHNYFLPFVIVVTAVAALWLLFFSHSSQMAATAVTTMTNGRK